MSDISQDSQKRYYEAQLQKKVLYVPNLSNFLDKVNLQILKLPHEMQDPRYSEPVGTKYDDIVKSFVNAVEVAYANLSPVRKEYKEEYKEEAKDFKSAIKKMEWIYDLLEKADMLNDHIVARDLPDVKEDYDDTLIEEDENEPDEQSMPAPEQKGDDKAVGKVESENRGSVAEKDMAQGIPE